MKQKMPEQKNSDAGFSIIELIAAVGIIALATSIVAPRLSSSRQAMALRASAIALAASLKDTRAAARTSNQERILVIDTATRQYGSFGATKPKTIPVSIAVSYEAQSEVFPSASRGGFQFRPDGSATGGRISLRSGSQTAIVAVDWLTGAVTISWK
jgi:general secretion pathway protein H